MECPLWARSGHRQLYSIISAALASGLQDVKLILKYL